MTELELVDNLQRMAREAGSQKAAAHTLGITQQYFNDLIHRRRSPGEKVLKKLGLVRVVYYEHG